MNCECGRQTCSSIGSHSQVNEEINKEIERVTQEKMGDLAEGESSGPSIITPA